MPITGEVWWITGPDEYAFGVLAVVLGNDFVFENRVEETGWLHDSVDVTVVLEERGGWRGHQISWSAR